MLVVEPGYHVEQAIERSHVLQAVAVAAESTSVLVAAVGRRPQARRPSVLVNASGGDYVGDAGDVVVSEEAPAGESFLASVCVAWEAAARRAEALGLRVVLMRTPLVLARDALALKLMALPFRLLLGGRLGSGKQCFPWVHMADIVGLYGLAVERGDLRGPVNAVAPDVRRQADVAAELGRVLGRPAAVPTPASLLRLVLGEQADLLLHGQRAVSRKLSAYAFRHPQLRDALEDALR